MATMRESFSTRSITWTAFCLSIGSKTKQRCVRKRSMTWSTRNDVGIRPLDRDGRLVHPQALRVDDRPKLIDRRRESFDLVEHDKIELERPEQFAARRPEPGHQHIWIIGLARAQTPQQL